MRQGALGGPAARTRHPDPGGVVRRLVVACGVLVVIAGCSAPADGRGPAPGRSPGGSTAPGPQVGPAAMAKSRPVELTIPAIDVSSSLIPLGLRPDGTMQVPPKGFPAGWYTGAPTPGELGPAIVVGHVDWAGRRAVFARLRQLTAGDRVDIRREDGTLARFRVTRVRTVDKDAFPTDLVYGNLDRAGLRLITCGGPFDKRRDSYRDNIIVFAELSEP